MDIDLWSLNRGSSTVENWSKFSFTNSPLWWDQFLDEWYIECIPKSWALKMLIATFCWPELDNLDTKVMMLQKYCATYHAKHTALDILHKRIKVKVMWTVRLLVEFSSDESLCGSRNPINHIEFSLIYAPESLKTVHFECATSWDGLGTLSEDLMMTLQEIL